MFAGVCHLSKLSQLKQDAYQAGKKKDWDQAVSIYEKILELEKNNPTVVNEMGDLCLKAGEAPRAVSHFLKAAAKYRTTGLLNNAVAIYKKILRHDPGNLNAHWFLAETRASQGLIQEGEGHALEFLTGSEDVSGELKEIFLGRCRELFELYSDSQVILEQLLKVFRTWNLGLEASRTLCLVACLEYQAGNEQEARQGISDVTSRSPEIVNYPEYSKWNRLINPSSTAPAAAGAFSDFGSVSFDGPVANKAAAKPAAPVVEGVDAPQAPEETVQPDAAADLGTAPESGSSAAADETSFGDLQLEVDRLNSIPDEPEATLPAGVVVPDDDGCFTLDSCDGASLEDLIAEAAGAEPDEVEVEDQAPVHQKPATPADPAPADHALSGDVDLLAEILAEDSGDFGLGEAGQLDTITQEIGAQVGGGDDADDADRLYEMGLVYLEMGLFDQACASLEKAAADPEFALRAREMWGIGLSRAGRPDDAVAVLSAGLDQAEAGSPESLGLLYHIGRAHEQAGRQDAAQECYRNIQAQDRSFLDVGKRLASLTPA